MGKVFAHVEVIRRNGVLLSQHPLDGTAARKRRPSPQGIDQVDWRIVRIPIEIEIPRSETHVIELHETPQNRVIRSCPHKIAVLRLP